MTKNIKNIKMISPEEYDCEFEHPIYGWIPYTALKNSGEEEMEEIYQICSSKERSLATDTIILRSVHYVREKLSSIILKYTSKYTQQERDMWDLKRIEAEKVVSGAGSAILDVEASIAGESVIDIANKIIKKSDEYRIAVVKVETLKRNLEKDVAELKTLKQLDDFNSKYDEILKSLEE